MRTGYAGALLGERLNGVQIADGVIVLGAIVLAQRARS
jgi:drug/metabolite transporter (DMT)-like permease